jgi:CHAD domain-containing protein
MKKAEEIKYFDKEWKDMKASLESFLLEGIQENLHRFRVQVKKLTAFIILADSAEHFPKLAKHFKPARKVFKQAGEVRDIYMNLELAKKYNTGNDAFLIEQHQLLEKTTGEFILNGNKHLQKLKDTRKAFKGKIKPISDLHIGLFYQTRLEQIAASLAKIKFDDRLHQCRKLIKVLIYNLKLVRHLPDTGFNEDYLGQVQTAIGDWHDNVLATALFSNDKETVSLLKKQNTRLKKYIKSLVEDFYNRATTVVEIPVEQIS